MKHKLLPLGPSLDHGDINAWQYGDYFITLHLTVMLSIRVRLMKGRDDPAQYRVIADWCCGSEKNMTGLFLHLGFCIFVDAVDRGYADKLPHSSAIRPVFLDPDFKDWVMKHCVVLTREESRHIYREINRSDSRLLLQMMADQLKDSP